MPTNNIWKRKIRMVEFKERITQNASNKSIFDPIKKEKWKSFEDTVKRITKIKTADKIQDIVEQKISLGYLQQNQIKVDQLSSAIVSIVTIFYSCFITSCLSRWCNAKRKKDLIYMVQLIHSQITTYY